MRKIKWTLDVGFVGCVHEGEIEVEDDATEDDIEEEVKEEAYNFLNLSWLEES